jgi:hypothetical protein
MRASSREHAMRLAELLKGTQWKTVKRVLGETFPEYRRALPHFRHAYKHIRTLAPIKSDMRICLDAVVPEEPNETPYLSVSGRNGRLQREEPDFHASDYGADSPFGQSEVAYGLSPVPWATWLGMSIDSDTLMRCSREGIVAHCLWEMTWDGYDEDTIRKKWDRLRADRD